MNPLTYMPTVGDLLIAALAVWRLSAMLVYEGMFEWLRQKAQVDFVDDNDVPITRMGRVLSCFWCTSLYVSPFVIILMVLNMRWLLLYLAASGGSILLHHWSRVRNYVEG